MRALSLVVPTLALVAACSLPTTGLLLHRDGSPGAGGALGPGSAQPDGGTAWGTADDSGFVTEPDGNVIPTTVDATMHDATVTVPTDAAMDARPTDATSDGDACILETHTDGLGDTFPACGPTGIYSESLAMRACAAYILARDAGDPAALCNDGYCPGWGDAVISGTGCGQNPIWGYDQAMVGVVSVCTGCQTHVEKATWE